MCQKFIKYFKADQSHDESKLLVLKGGAADNVQNRRVSHEVVEKAKFDDLLTDSFYALRKVCKLVTLRTLTKLVFVILLYYFYK